MIQNPSGLTSEQAKKLLAEYGFNAIATKTDGSALRVFLSQFTNPLVYVLVGVSLITAYLHEYTDTIVILTVVGINAVIGTFQEVKAKNTLNSLKDLLSPHAKAFRDGQIVDILAEELVPGDTILIEAGDRISADAILLEATNLQINESQLTGESYPVAKNTADNNRVFMGTIATTGRALAEVQKTGLTTELGQISQTVAKHITQATPLEKKFEALSRQIVVAVAGICGVIFLLGMWRQFSLEDMFKVGVSLGVSAIPEGLPIVVTVTLAIGVYRMSQKKAVIRNLPSVSTLAGVDVICTDKTGTITEGRVELAQTWVPVGGKLSDEVNPDFLKLAVLCNDAEVGATKVGDLLDIALLEFAEQNTLHIAEIRDELPRIDEIPFDSDNKYQATLNKERGGNLLIVKGAFEKLLPHCNFTNNELKQEIEAKTESLAQQGFKVLLLACKKTSDTKLTKDMLSDLGFEGLLVFFDPMRKDVSVAVRACHDAGVKVIMITGDHLETAKTIAKQAGIYKDGELAVDSRSFQKKLSELADELKLRVIARASPLDKSALIGLLKTRKHVVAMTGDGVNDAPALVQADIGIAMGVVGTDAAREAADMVLLDDKFSTIVNGIFEARGVFENIRKVISYLFTASYGEIFVIMGGLLIMAPLPLIAVQILWLNVITDALLDISIATENNTQEIMKKNHQRYRGPVIDRLLLLRIAILGSYMGLGSLWLFTHELQNNSLEYARTTCLVVLAMFQWFHAFNARSEDQSLLEIGIFRNRTLLLSLVAVILLCLLAVYNPLFQNLLSTEAVKPDVWYKALALSFPIILVEEVRKSIFKKYNLTRFFTPRE